MAVRVKPKEPTRLTSVTPATSSDMTCRMSKRPKCSTATRVNLGFITVFGVAAPLRAYKSMKPLRTLHHILEEYRMFSRSTIQSLCDISFLALADEGSCLMTASCGDNLSPPGRTKHMECQKPHDTL